MKTCKSCGQNIPERQTVTAVILRNRKYIVDKIARLGDAYPALKRRLPRKYLRPLLVTVEEAR